MTRHEEKRPTSASNNAIEREVNHANDNDTVSSKTRDTSRIWGVRLPPYFDSDPESAVKRKLDLVLFYSRLTSRLHLYGNQLNIFGTMFNCGIIVGAVPLILLSTHIRPSILMPTCELCWSILVMGIAGAKDYQTIYGLRFFIGFFEAIAFPGFASLLAAWYTPAELGKRMAIYEVSQNVAGMFSGYIQAGLWLFIFDGIISLPIAIWGFWAIPDQPKDSKAWWLDCEEYGRRGMSIFLLSVMYDMSSGKRLPSSLDRPNGPQIRRLYLHHPGLPAQSLTMTWLSEVCQGNATLRGLIVSIGNTFIYAINAWALVLLFPASDAPHYRYGYQICAGMIGVGVVSVFVILYAIWADIRSGRAWRNQIGLLEYRRWIRESEEDGSEDETQNPTLPTHVQS
uniref:Pantothenate transporter FEN2 n=1 Tax=Talaromyces marneffei PM1 TaxID=1077442 RepID=A0A093V5M0_TALMA